MSTPVLFNLADIYFAGAKVGSAQTCTAEFGQTTKAMPGPEKWSKATAITDQTLKLKFSTTEWRGSLLAKLQGLTITTGKEVPVKTLNATPDATHIITVTHSADYGDTLAVIDAATGDELKRVTSAPAAGEYSVAAGVYTFSAGQGPVDIHDTKKLTTGHTATAYNGNASFAPTFKVRLYNEDSGFGLVVYAAAFGNSSVGFKLKDFGEVGLEADAQDPGNGRIYDWTY